MCHPRNDDLIVAMLKDGRLRVDGSGQGTVFLLDRRSTVEVWREVGQAHRAQQAGKRPKAGYYRRFVVRFDDAVRTLRVSRVIYVALHGPTCHEIDHIDDDPLNCGDANLAALTRHENQHKAQHAAWLRSRGAGPDEDYEYGEVPF